MNKTKEEAKDRRDLLEAKSERQNEIGGFRGNIEEEDEGWL